MCIVSVPQANPAVKPAQILRWRQQIDLTPQDADLLDALIGGRSLSNALIFEEYSEIGRYLFCRLLDPEIAAAPPPPRQADLFGGDRPVDLTTDILRSRMSVHPLMKPFIALAVDGT